jgi:peptidoglycan DL-endopeptidase CwlO
MLIKKLLVFVLIALALVAQPGRPDDNEARVATLSPSDVEDYAAQPAAVQRLLAHALELTTRNLSYQYGSSDPTSGGMDCSGTVYYLLLDAGIKNPPRDASEMYRWVWTESRFQAVESVSADSFEYSRLKPGDLLFWTGTYDVTRDPPITHVMIYLGISRLTGRRVMVGASDGRRFNGVSRYGVSVFDMELPRHEAGDSGTSRFIGYGPVPGLLDVR